jgi:PIN domain nuclease of toxin-antitoxin system
LKILLDTHVLLWILSDPDRLSNETHHVLVASDNEIFVSLVSLWEIVVKRRTGKLKVDLAAIIAHLAPASRIQPLALTPQHLLALDALPFHDKHRDPFDHLIIAQAITEGMLLITQDRHASLYPVRVRFP